MSVDNGQAKEQATNFVIQVRSALLDKKPEKQYTWITTDDRSAIKNIVNSDEGQKLFFSAQVKEALLTRFEEQAASVGFYVKPELRRNVLASLVDDLFEVQKSESRISGREVDPQKLIERTIRQGAQGIKKNPNTAEVKFSHVEKNRRPGQVIEATDDVISHTKISAVSGIFNELDLLRQAIHLFPQKSEELISQKFGSTEIFKDIIVAFGEDIASVVRAVDDTPSSHNASWVKTVKTTTHHQADAITEMMPELGELNKLRALLAATTAPFKSSDTVIILQKTDTQKMLGLRDAVEGVLCKPEVITLRNMANSQEKMR